MYNDTLFMQYAGFEYSPNLNFEALQTTVSVKLNVTKEILEWLKEYFSEDDIIYSSIFESISLIQLCLLSLPYELEKAWYIVNESIENQREREMRISVIETMLYGKKISKTTDELEICMAYLNKKFYDNSILLWEFEKNEFQNYLNKIQEELQINTSYNFPKILKEWISLHFLRRYWSTLIQKEKYIIIFQLALDISGMQNHKILPWNGWNIAITRDAMLIPESSSYSELPLIRVLSIITHEIMVHWVCWKNQKRFFWMFKWGKYRIKEEWLAMYMESRMIWENPKTINLKPVASTRILAGEILNGKDFLKFIKIYRKLTNQKTSSVKKTFLRHKLYHSKNLNGVCRSDLNYIRGLKAISEYVLDWKNISYLFSGKISVLQAEECWPKLIGDENFVLPIPISDYVIFKLSKTEQFPSFISYLDHKYPDINYVFQDIDTISTQKKDKLIELEDIFSKLLYG